MTVTSTEKPRKQYTGNDSTVAFPITFPYADDGDIVVENVTNGVSVTWILNGTGDDGYTIASDTVTANTAPASLTYLVLSRSTDQTQETDLRQNRRFNADTEEDMFDKQTYVAQELQEQSDRSLKLTAANADGIDTELPPPSANSPIGWDAAGTGLKNFSSTIVYAANWDTIQNYTDLADAVSTIGATPTTLLIDTADTIDANIIIPSTLDLFFVRGGVLSDDANNADLTINGQVIAAPGQQIFDWGNGTGSITSTNSVGGSIDTVLLLWFGVDNNGSGDTTTTYKQARDLAIECAARELFWPTGKYIIDNLSKDLADDDFSTTDGMAFVGQAAPVDGNDKSRTTVTLTTETWLRSEGFRIENIFFAGNQSGTADPNVLNNGFLVYTKAIFKKNRFDRFNTAVILSGTHPSVGVKSPAFTDFDDCTFRYNKIALSIPSTAVGLYRFNRTSFTLNSIEYSGGDFGKALSVVSGVNIIFNQCHFELNGRTTAGTYAEDDYGGYQTGGKITSIGSYYEQHVHNMTNGSFNSYGDFFAASARIHGTRMSLIDIPFTEDSKSSGNLISPQPNTIQNINDLGTGNSLAGVYEDHVGYLDRYESTSSAAAAKRLVWRRKDLQIPITERTFILVKVPYHFENTSVNLEAGFPNVSVTLTADDGSGPVTSTDYTSGNGDDGSYIGQIDGVGEYGVITAFYAIANFFGFSSDYPFKLEEINVNLNFGTSGADFSADNLMVSVGQPSVEIFAKGFEGIKQDLGWRYDYDSTALQRYMVPAENTAIMGMDVIGVETNEGVVRRIFFASAMPSSGTYRQGDIVKNTGGTIDGNNMVLTGWYRLTTGSAHVAGTDWSLMYVSHVSPAT